jgi:hypothetical protein
MRSRKSGAGQAHRPLPGRKKSSKHHPAVLCPRSAARRPRPAPSPRSWGLASRRSTGIWRAFQVEHRPPKRPMRSTAQIVALFQMEHPRCRGRRRRSWWTGGRPERRDFDPRHRQGGRGGSCDRRTRSHCRKCDAQSRKRKRYQRAIRQRCRKCTTRTHWPGGGEAGGVSWTPKTRQLAKVEPCP